jgi:hypothetical protein
MICPPGLRRSAPSIAGGCRGVGLWRSAVAEVAGLFGETHGYNVLLALEEAGAHVEYLYQRGELGIENLQELAGSSGPVPIHYRRQEKILST